MPSLQVYVLDDFITSFCWQRSPAKPSPHLKKNIQKINKHKKKIAN